MALPSFFFRRLVLLILLVAFSLVSVALPQEACTKGVPTIAKITGPGLTRPIRLSGPEFPAPVGAWKLPGLTGAHYWKAAIYGASTGLVEYDDTPRPEVGLGPRYTVVFFIWKDSKTSVLQHLFPFATSGPLTFTPPGQADAFWRVFGEHEIRGWRNAPVDLTTFLIRRGLPASSPRATVRSSFLPHGVAAAGPTSCRFLERP